MGRRIHLVSAGGGTACGAHSLGRPHGQRVMLATHLLALVDCRKCQTTDQYRHILRPTRQYQLRLFALVNDTSPPQRLGVADISVNPAFHRVEVLLDGVPQPDFVSYDAQKGWVERYRRVDGKFVVAKEALATERVAGTVLVQWRRAA